jgi:hypothetical protein
MPFRGTEPYCCHDLWNASARDEESAPRVSRVGSCCEHGAPLHRLETRPRSGAIVEILQSSGAVPSSLGSPRLAGIRDGRWRGMELRFAAAHREVETQPSYDRNIFYLQKLAQLLPPVSIELVIAHAAAAHPSPPRSCLLGETWKHERGWPHIELSPRPRRRNVLFRLHNQTDLNR